MTHLFMKLTGYFQKISTITAVASLCVLVAGCSGFPLGKKEDPSIVEKVDPVLFNKEIFGEEVSKPITSGYLIFKGRYIPPPYVIKRSGLSLFINDLMVVGPMKWRNPNAEKPRNPPEPLKISMWCGSAIITEYINATFTYYEALYKEPNPPQDKTMLAAIAAHIKKLPNVWDAEVDEERQLIRITLCNFSNFNVSSSSVFGENSMEISEESLRDMYHRGFEKHVSYFKENKIVYRGITISEIEWRENTKTFYDAVKILNSSSWNSTKKNRLAEIDFGSSKIISDIASCFKPSKELEKRLYEEYIRGLDSLNKQDTITPYDKFK
ncbi:MAG TPA: hypothetical protein DET40_18520 [Lentisphaeria bacterium]|nr:MAG: hypothetical protein A2X45_14660 [Lentisphaerae bacterium GWF2_50_93]HCE45539.1 hypothetical protein [Lentisphaeria bacterium]